MEVYLPALIERQKNGLKVAPGKRRLSLYKTKTVLNKNPSSY